jgi:MtN3 and saliva related transmembrane protein
MVHHNVGIKFLNKKKNKELVDKLMYVVGVISPLTALPQLYNIWINKSIVGVSIVSWLLFTVIAACWLVYGLAHKEKPIIINNILWLIVDLIIVVGLIIY